VAREQPELVRTFNPWDELVEPAQLLGLYERSGIDGATAELVDAYQPLRRPEDWWDIVMGSGFRGTVEQLAPDARRRVREQNLAAVEGVQSVRTAAVYGLAVKR
jgi:hypothetical protein